jgi:hypothetical protein
MPETWEKYMWLVPQPEPIVIPPLKGSRTLCKNYRKIFEWIGDAFTPILVDYYGPATPSCEVLTYELLPATYQDELYLFSTIHADVC